MTANIRQRRSCTPCRGVTGLTRAEIVSDARAILRRVVTK